MTWTILIPTLPERASMLRRLLNILEPQLVPGVKISINDAGRSMTTGEKRNLMIQNCDTDYFSFCDDDDLVTERYVPAIKTAIDLNPDVVTFNGWMTTNGAARVDFIIKIGEKYEEREGKYYRFPNHLCCFKRELVERFKFPPVTQGEDYQWAKRINDNKVLKTEIHLNEQLYHYDKIHTEQPKPRRRR